MKKYLIYLITIITLLSICIVMNTKNYNSVPVENAKFFSSVKTGTYESPCINPGLENELTYKNYSCGYQITFPKTWKGYYVIEVKDKSSIRVNFWGKSKTATILGKSFNTQGLPMFMIVSEKYIENEALDNVRKIGKIKGINYFYATGTGSDISMLKTVGDEDSPVKHMNMFVIDEDEVKLSQKDWEKVNIMYSEINEMLKTFCPIS